MKLEIDTKNRFTDRNFTAIVIIGILTLANTIMMCIILAHQCPGHPNMENQWMHQQYNAAMMRR